MSDMDEKVTDRDVDKLAKFKHTHTVSHTGLATTLCRYYYVATAGHAGNHKKYHVIVLFQPVRSSARI